MPKPRRRFRRSCPRVSDPDSHDIRHVKPRNGHHRQAWTISTWAPRSRLAGVEAVTATTAVNLLIGLAVLALILVRQMQVRPVRANMRLPLILVIIGVIELTQFLRQNPHIHHAGTIFAVLVGSLALAVITAAIRAVTVRIWIDSGQALRQGTWITAVLWIASLAAHLGLRLPSRGQRRTGWPGHRLADPVLRGHLHDPAAYPPGAGPVDRGNLPDGHPRPRQPHQVMLTCTVA